MVWTEIIDEDFCVTHVGDFQALVAIGDVTEDQCHEAVQYLEDRKAKQYLQNEQRRLKNAIERDMAYMEALKEAGAEELLQYPHGKMAW